MKIIILLLLLFINPLYNSNDKQKKKYSPLTKFKITQKYNINHKAIDIISMDRKVYAIESCIINKIILPDYQYPIKYKDTPLMRAWSPSIKCSNDKYDFYYTHVLTNIKINTFLYPGQFIGNYYYLGNSSGAHLHLEIYLKNTSKKINYMEQFNVN